MFRTRFGSSTNDNAGLYNKGGVSIKRSTPAEVASASTDVTAVSIKPWKRIVIPVITVIAMVIIALFSLSGCGGGDARSGSSTGDGAERPLDVSVKPSLNDYSWDELSWISEEISKEATEQDAIEVAKKYNLVNPDGKLDGTQIKEIKLSDGSPATVQVVGFLHDDKTGSGKAGITFIFKDAIEKDSMSSIRTNLGGWKDSEMRSWLEKDGLLMLPQDLRSVIITVKKETNNVGGEEGAPSVTSTSDKLWLFSVAELYATTEWNSVGYIQQFLSTEGSQYKLFRDCDVNAEESNSILTKSYDDGSPCAWWERSLIIGSHNSFGAVGADGRQTGQSASQFHGVVPGFCI